MRMTAALPALFLFHGAPSLPLEDRPTSHFLTALGAAPPRPQAIVMISAHYETDGAEVSLAALPETIYGYSGFSDALRAMRHPAPNDPAPNDPAPDDPAPGDPALARQVADLLRGAGLTVRTHPTRGLDHGAWTPLKLMDPEARIPPGGVAVDQP
jgi:4,5-DOPA dioxygenase extradiol